MSPLTSWRSKDYSNEVSDLKKFSSGFIFVKMIGVTMIGNNAEGMIQIVKKADCELANTHLDKAGTIANGTIVGS